MKIKAQKKSRNSRKMVKSPQTKIKVRKFLPKMRNFQMGSSKDISTTNITKQVSLALSTIQLVQKFPSIEIE